MPREPSDERNQKRCARCKMAATECWRTSRSLWPTRNAASRTPRRFSMCATRIAEGVVLDEVSIEDLRMTAWLFNTGDLGTTNEVLCKAAEGW